MSATSDIEALAGSAPPPAQSSAAATPLTISIHAGSTRPPDHPTRRRTCATRGEYTAARRPVKRDPNNLLPNPSTKRRRPLRQPPPRGLASLRLCAPHFRPPSAAPSPGSTVTVSWPSPAPPSPMGTSHAVPRLAQTARVRPLPLSLRPAARRLYRFSRHNFGLRPRRRRPGAPRRRRRSHQHRPSLAAWRPFARPSGRRTRRPEAPTSHPNPHRRSFSYSVTRPIPSSRAASVRFPPAAASAASTRLRS